MTILKEVFCTRGRISFVNVKISMGTTKPIVSKEEGIKKVQSLIKVKMDEIERIPGWKLLPPPVSNAIRHAIIRIAFGAYKIGLIG